MVILSLLSERVNRRDDIFAISLSLKSSTEICFLIFSIFLLSKSINWTSILSALLEVEVEVEVKTSLTLALSLTLFLLISSIIAFSETPVFSASDEIYILFSTELFISDRNGITALIHFTLPSILFKSDSADSLFIIYSIKGFEPLEILKKPSPFFSLIKLSGSFP